MTGRIHRKTRPRMAVGRARTVKRVEARGHKARLKRMKTWEKAASFAQEAFDLVTGIPIPNNPAQPDVSLLDEMWHLAVVSGHHRAHTTLKSIVILLDPEPDDTASALILVRHLMECAANLSYIHIDVAHRLPDYLRLGAFPASPDRDGNLELKSSDAPSAPLPRRRWRTLKEVCDELGWTMEYESVYKMASDTAHGGTSALVIDGLPLFGISVPVDAKGIVLILGVIQYLRILRLVASLLPSKIDAARIEKLWQAILDYGPELTESSAQAG